MIVDGERAKARAIERVDRPATTPLEISSRSAKVNERADRRGGGGLMPPVGIISSKRLECRLPSARPISISPSPLFQRSQTSARSAAVSYFRFMTLAPHPQSKVHVASIS
jgi:hypothetical protein